MAQPRIVDVGRWSMPGLAVLSYGFRPFFLLGSITAAVGIPVWLAMLVYGIEPSGPFTGLHWHVHEMIFGYLAAVMAGFALTAVPNWTGRLPLSGLPLAGLCALWIIGRIASSFVATAALALVLDCAFLFALAAAIWREILAGSNYRNLPIAILFTLMAIANLAFHVEASRSLLPDHGYAWRGALGVAAIMVALIGGRIVPSFTRNWMARLSIEPMPVPFGQFDKSVLLISAGAAVAWVVSPDASLTGVLLLAAGVLNLLRLVRWRGHRTWREPIVVILHLAYLWLSASFLLLGLAAFGILDVSIAIHVLTAGAIGTMTLAVMTRASLGHTGHAIAADLPTIAIYGLVTAGAALRVLAPMSGAAYLSVLTTGGLLWSGAFALFVIAYGRLLLTPGAGRT